MILSHRILVLTNNGIKRVECLSPSDLIFTGDGYSTFTFENINDQDVTEIATEHGYSLSGDFKLSVSSNFQINEIKIHEATENYFTVLSFNDEYSKIDIKDNLEIPVIPEKYKTDSRYKRYKNIQLPETITNELAYLLGYSYGDGYTDRESVLELACGNTWPEIISKLINIFENTLIFTPSISDGDGALQRIRFSNQCIVEYLRINHILKQKAGSLILPDFIFKNYSLFVSFYSGFFDADGYASGRKKGYSLSIIDYNVISDLQVLLLGCGIASRIHAEDRTKQGWNTLYSLSICGTHSQEKIVNGFRESVKINKSAFVSARECIVSPHNSNTFKIKYYNYRYCPGNDEYLSIRTIDRLNSDRIEETNIPNNLFRSKITKINKIKTNTVKIEGVRSIWANGFIISSSTGDSK